MSHVTGLVIIDAPASALNNAGQAKDEKNNNVIAVKLINTPDGLYPYVSAQAIRYWLRSGFVDVKGWNAPTFRDDEISYTAADPLSYIEDDLFGYMRAPTGMESEKKARDKGLTPLSEEKRDGKVKPVSITRISPFRVGTAVATSPLKGKPTRDWGTMARAEGHPVIHLHDFYRAHLKAPIAIDLVSAGTFFVSDRVGYKNLDKHRIENAKAAGAAEVTVRGLNAYRLPPNTRRKRVAQLISGLGRMEGGAKQTLHLTDTAPAVLVLAVCRSGNQPFQRLIGSDDLEHTVFRTEVLDEALRVFKEDIQSDLHIGWSKGFLEAERAKLTSAIKDGKHASGRTIHVGHPREIAEMFAGVIGEDKNAAWFD